MTRTHDKVGDAPAGRVPAGEAAAGTAPEPACLTPGGAADLVDAALGVLGGRWKLAILFRLFADPVLRFSELERAIPGVSQKMLAQQLRELERDGVVARAVHAEVPPRVDYQLTEAGRALRPALGALRDWAASRRDRGSDRGRRG